MANKTTEIRIHLEESFAETIKRLASKEDVSISRYGRRIMINHLQTLGLLTVEDALKALR